MLPYKTQIFILCFFNTYKVFNALSLFVTIGFFPSISHTLFFLLSLSLSLPPTYFFNKTHQKIPLGPLYGVLSLSHCRSCTISDLQFNYLLHYIQPTIKLSLSQIRSPKFIISLCNVTNK